MSERPAQLSSWPAGRLAGQLAGPLVRAWLREGARGAAAHVPLSALRGAWRRRHHARPGRSLTCYAHITSAPSIAVQL